MYETPSTGSERTCACGRAIRARHREKCCHCLPRYIVCHSCGKQCPRKVSGLCRECTTCLARFQMAMQRGGIHRPHDGLLEWLLCYYADRAAQQLPLFEPHPMTVFRASCPPLSSTLGGNASPLAGQKDGSVM